jgi:hypothetical protein
MDANPWLYAVMTQELRREGKIAGNAPPGQDRIPDPRRFVYVEACAAVGNAALSVSVRARDAWVSSDRGLPQYRVVRDGCFRVAVPVPDGTRVNDVRALRLQAYARPPADGKASAPPGPVRLTQINRVFMLDQNFIPGPSILKLHATASIDAGGSPFEVQIP